MHPGSPAHLFRRFFDVATAQGLTASERSTVSDWLTAETGAIFFAQNNADQRHGYHAAQSVIAFGIKDQAVVAAALLHDVGKRHARLGIIGRSIASILSMAGLALTERMRTYHDHGLEGARELASLGVPSLVIDFAMHHHDQRPASIDTGTWNVLIAADQPPKPLWRR